jgi:pyruvate-formate lyase-activating enzyme
MEKLPLLIVSDKQGRIFEIPGLYMAGMSLYTLQRPASAELIPLPYGSELFMLPGRRAIGYDPKQQAFTTVREYQGQQVYAVAAFMAPAYVHFYRSAFETEAGATRLSLFCYAAAGWYQDGFYTTGMRIDADCRQDWEHFDLLLIRKNARLMKRRYPANRLVAHLADKCVCEYGCPAARNFVMGRWECPVPTSPTCNAACVGCISRQPAESRVASTQERIKFIPTVDEIVEFTVPHLERAPRAVISFGQGCEGEPLLVSDVLEESIRAIRKRTERGIINLNTNASRPDAVERLFKAGLDSIRVSLNSAREEYYQAYYRPRGYGYQDVVVSLRLARQYRKWSSLNYMIFPGLTDHPDEVAALERLVADVKVNMIQTRNLNIDPEWYMAELGLTGSDDRSSWTDETSGVARWVERIQKKFPWIKLGYFNPPREEMVPRHFRFT